MISYRLYYRNRWNCLLWVVELAMVKSGRIFFRISELFWLMIGMAEAEEEVEGMVKEVDRFDQYHLCCCCC